MLPEGVKYFRTGAWAFHSAPLVPLFLKMGTRFSLVLLNADGWRNIVAVTPLADGSHPICNWLPMSANRGISFTEARYPGFRWVCFKRSATRPDPRNKIKVEQA
jgi:hypothetical protein